LHFNTISMVVGLGEVGIDIDESQGLMDASDKHGFEGNGYQYLKNPIWWAGMITSKTLGDKCSSRFKY
jgi:hypothetical protein